MYLPAMKRRVFGLLLIFLPITVIGLIITPDSFPCASKQSGAKQPVIASEADLAPVSVPMLLPSPQPPTVQSGESQAKSDQSYLM